MIRQVKGECASLARSALEFDLSTQELRYFSRDRKSQPCPSVFSACGGVRLLEGLEDNLVLGWRDSDSRVSDRERDYLLGPTQNFMVARPPMSRHSNVKLYAALGGELESIGEKIPQNLLHALGIAFEGSREVDIRLDLEIQLLRERHGPEARLNLVLNVPEADSGHVHRHRSRLDLREVEDIVDE